MKIKIILLTGLLVLTGCSQSAETTAADNGLVETQSIDRVTTAADVHVADSYSFAVGDEVVSGYDTYKQSNQITITSDDIVGISVYGSNQPITDVEGTEPIIQHSFKSTDDEIVLKEQFTYYTIVADEECDIVIAAN